MLVKLHGERFNALRAKLGSKCRPFAALGDPAERALQDLLALQVTLDGFEETARHVIAVREFEADRDQSLKFFGRLLWEPKLFGNACSMEIGEFWGRKSAASNGTKSGRVEPLEGHEYPDGDQPL